MRREERIKLPDGTLVPVSQSITVPIAEWQALKAQVEEGTLYNTEETITESGTWTAKVTGWHDVTIIGGGVGARRDVFNRIFPGYSGWQSKHLKYFEAGDIVEVTVGAAGQACDEVAGQPVSIIYGSTSGFGELHAGFANYFLGSRSIDVNASGVMVASYGEGGGFGGGTYSVDGGNAQYYGAGGGGRYDQNTGLILGNGAPGAVIIRYYDPNKA